MFYRKSTKHYDRYHLRYEARDSNDRPTPMESAHVSLSIPSPWVDYALNSCSLSRESDIQVVRVSLLSEASLLWHIASCVSLRGVSLYHYTLQSLRNISKQHCKLHLLQSILRYVEHSSPIRSCLRPHSSCDNHRLLCVLLWLHEAKEGKSTCSCPQQRRNIGQCYQSTGTSSRQKSR